MTNSIAELEDAPLILAAGTNTTESHPVLALRVKRAVAKGAKLIVADPRGIELTRFASRWLRLKIGSDIALFNAMARVILKEELYDKDFVRERTEGIEELAAMVESYTPGRAQRITGVPRREIVAAARDYARAERAAIIYTLGLTEHTCGVHNVQSLANLALLCGNLGIPSAGVNPLRGQNNVQGAGDMGCLPAMLPGYAKIIDPEARRHWEKAWDCTLDPQPGFTKLGALDAILEGRVRAAFIMGENTLISDANMSKTRRALESLDLMVVQDLFLTETARMADVVLPAAAFAEVDGTYTNTERRVQRVRKAVPPPGEAKADWEILRDLARAMGHDWDYRHPRQIWDEVADLTPLLRGIRYERIEREGLQWPCPDRDHPGTRFLHEGTFPTGKGRFMAVPHTPVAEPPDEEYPFILTTGRRRATYHTGTQTGRALGFDKIAPHEWLEVSPQDASDLGIGDEEEVDVVSRRGRLRLQVRITDRSPAGVVFSSFAFPDKAPINLLTTDAHDPTTDTAEYKACAVRLERLGA